jgi:hypothetical protein
MSDFLAEGLDVVQSSLCPVASIQRLVIVCLERNEKYDQLKSLRGRLGVSDLRVLCNNVTATIVSISLDGDRNNNECPLKQPPTHSYLDEDILSPIQLVQIWNVQGSRRLSDSSYNTPRSVNKQNSKVAQLQRQQELARQNRIQSQKKPSKDDTDDDSSHEEKKRRKSKSKSKSSRDKQPTNNEIVPLSSQREPALTVSSFLSRQKSMQKEAETYRSNSTTAQNNKMLLTNGREDDYDNRSPVSRSPTIDTVPSDHPSSSIIQTHRTCTVCHRTLCRSQFSERDRYLVHLSLGPGAVCRTCSMTGECYIFVLFYACTSLVCVDYSEPYLTSIFSCNALQSPQQNLK